MDCNSSLPTEINTGCNIRLKGSLYEVRKGVLYKDGEKYANVVSIHDGVLKAVIDNGNKYMKGIEINLMML